MKTGFYQFDPSFGEKEENFKKVEQALQSADLDLLVLPEFFATGYQFVSEDEVAELSEPIQGGRTTEFLIQLSQKKQIYIAAGLAERDGDRFFNSAVLTGPEGLIGVYRKTHLYFEENLYFTPGDTGFRVWDTKAGRIGIMICFDWFFPESARSLAVQGAEIIAHPANLVLPYCPDAMPVRCLENRVFSVTANRIGTEDRKGRDALTFIGQSEIVTPDGKILIRAPKDQEVLMITDIEPEQAQNKVLNQYNDVLKDRIPGNYTLFEKDT
ncbi:MAG TPA: acyltransferase [Nitrospirae bacterium]|nr:acyltransferase [Nitrospirota bacterium]